MGIGLEVSSDVATAAVIVNEIENGSTASAQATEQAKCDCANCGTNTVGKYCHGCGQSTHIHRSLLHMVEELLHGLFHFDTKAWRTIPALILNPGQLTRDYIEGKRTSYVSPLALFLFLIFLMFFVFSLTMKDPDPKVFNNNLSKEELVQEIGKSKEKLSIQAAEETVLLKNHASPIDKRDEMEETKSEIRDLQAKLDAIENRDISKEDLLLAQAEVKTRLANLKEQEAKLSTGDALLYETRQQIRFAERELASLERKIKKFEMQASSRGGIGHTAAKNLAANGPSFDMDVDIPGGGKLTANRELESVPYIGKTLVHANKNPELTFYKLKKNASSLAFLLMPISLPFLWLLFAFRRKFLMFDHAVFSLYSLSFMCVLLMIIALLNMIDFSGMAGFLFFLVPPIHMFRQLKAAYLLGFFGALWRTVALLFIAMISLLLYAVVVTSLSL